MDVIAKTNLIEKVELRNTEKAVNEIKEAAAAPNDERKFTQEARKALNGFIVSTVFSDRIGRKRQKSTHLNRRFWLNSNHVFKQHLLKAISSKVFYRVMLDANNRIKEQEKLAETLGIEGKKKRFSELGEYAKSLNDLITAKKSIEQGSKRQTSAKAEYCAVV
ncbi:MAG: hypothetical protein LBR70_03365 [Lactobacillaceae bacterium]|jgi:flagellar biosynthesis component FlhA|nr:hypothetical protein [Lactobacillaceae bacterium]